MNSVFGRYNYFFLLLLIFTVSEFVVNPIGDFPLNDDWSYGKAVYYSMSSHYTIGHFGAMTLFTHLLWGALFVKIFGFSFTVLRFSTLVSVIVGLFFLEKTIFDLTRNKLTGFFAGFVLLFNPLLFNLSNTFMTDVNFNTLLIICCFCALRFFRTSSYVYFIFLFILSCFLVLLRQFGLIVPVSFALCGLFRKEKRWITFVLAIAGTLAVYFTLKLYENYLSTILPPDSSYKFSGGVHPFDKTFRDIFAAGFKQRVFIILSHLLIYSAPFAVMFLYPLLKGVKKQISAGVITAAIFIAWWLFYDVEFPFHNIFGNIYLGPETFKESLNGTHLRSDTLQDAALIIKLLFITLTLSVILLFLISRIRKTKSFSLPKQEVIFLLALILTYSIMIFITESYFDRYHIPLITMMLILLSHMHKSAQISYKAALLPLALVFYVSVSGTKDYLTWNRLRWEAYNYLKETRQVNAEQVNGGFELNCWNDRKENWWYNYATLEGFDYLIQFKEEPGFALLKAYEFQRYFPYKKDKINIFVREAKE